MQQSGTIMHRAKSWRGEGMTNKICPSTKQEEEDDDEAEEEGEEEQQTGSRQDSNPWERDDPTSPPHIKRASTTQKLKSTRLNLPRLHPEATRLRADCPKRP